MAARFAIARLGRLNSLLILTAGTVDFHAARFADTQLTTLVTSTGDDLLLG